MRLKLMLWIDRVIYLFSSFDCEKESMGYRCRHEMHGNVPECGAWSKVRGIE